MRIPAKHHQSLIGSKGRLIRAIMDECGGVHIHFPNEGSGSDRVTIRGPKEEVDKAKKQLMDLTSERVSVVLARFSLASFPLHYSRKMICILYT